MASSNARARLACDGCGVTAWVGPAPDGFDAWCECCQRAVALPHAPTPDTRCAACGAALPAWPRFVELWGVLQQFDAVLAAWAGESATLAVLLPERPRFLGDLDPPPTVRDDAPALAALLEAVRHGDWHVALDHASAATGSARGSAALAIARERTGDLTGAIAAWDAVLALGEDARARLVRGALHARRGALAEAAADLALAGEGFEARWDRAALTLVRAVAERFAVPSPEVMARVRAEAGPPSDYWSDPTPGRLLWSLLAELALAAPASADSVAVLRAATTEFEHATFWDRSMQLVTWVRLGQQPTARALAQGLALEQADAALAEPALAGAALAEVALAVRTARAAAASDDPAVGRTALAPVLARMDLRRYRIPCARCGRGGIGLDETLETGRD